MWVSSLFTFRQGTPKLSRALIGISFVGTIVHLTRAGGGKTCGSLGALDVDWSVASIGNRSDKVVGSKPDWWSLILGDGVCNLDCEGSSAGCEIARDSSAFEGSLLINLC
jgi:hypothetical protein